MEKKTSVVIDGGEKETYIIDECNYMRMVYAMEDLEME